MKLNNSHNQELKTLLIGMQQAYQRGENAMQYARNLVGSDENSLIATLIAYDLQSGSYVADVHENPESKLQWSQQLAMLIQPYLTDTNTLLEVGLVYPILESIPLLCSNNAIIASKYGT